jgi:hypothetical protein
MIVMTRRQEPDAHHPIAANLCDARIDCDYFESSSAYRSLHIDTSREMLHFRAFPLSDSWSAKEPCRTVGRPGAEIQEEITH